jgi:hypothetical protein
MARSRGLPNVEYDSCKRRQDGGGGQMTTLPPNRRRRAASPPQAMIARAVRAARDAGPTWHVEIEADGHVVRLFQGAPTATQGAPPEPEFARGLGIVP